MPAGRPKGSLNDKPWKEAIRKAVARKMEDGGRALDLLARSLVSKGMTGDVSALTEIGNRLDGKASQPVEHSGHLDVSATLDRVITEMREREQSMREDVVRH